MIAELAKALWNDDEMEKYINGKENSEIRKDIDEWGKGIEGLCKIQADHNEMRFQIAKSAMQGLLSRSNHLTAAYVAKESVEYADALIKELQK